VWGRSFILVTNGSVTQLHYSMDWEHLCSQQTGIDVGGSTSAALMMLASGWLAAV
jgi:hypothetical protein